MRCLCGFWPLAHCVSLPVVVVIVVTGLTEAIRAAQAIATSMPEVIADWVGTDMNVAPQEDLICREPNVLLHNAVQRAYMSVRGNILEGLRTKLTTLLAAGYTPSTIKIFVTGHSLGAALATMATYDLWCNKETNLGITHDGNQHTQFELFGTITFGHFFTLCMADASRCDPSLP